MGLSWSFLQWGLCFQPSPVNQWHGWELLDRQRHRAFGGAASSAKTSWGSESCFRLGVRLMAAITASCEPALRGA